MIRALRITAALLVAAAALAGGLAWAELDGWWIAKKTPQALYGELEPDLRIFRPEGEGPFPTILLFHGCGGLWNGEKRIATMDQYAQIAVEEGVAAVVVDSYTPRGIDYERAYDKVCSGWLLRGAERAGDVVASLAGLRDLSWVDGERLALAGWSHGGWTVMDALAMQPGRQRPQNLAGWPDEPFRGVVASYLTYPYCGFPALAPRQGFAEQLPVRAILVNGDTTADPEPCDEAFDRLRAAGGRVEVTHLDGVTHAFDESEHGPGSTSRYSKPAALEAGGFFRDFLRRYLTAPPPATAS